MVESLLELSRYPLTSPGSPTLSSVIERARADLRVRGAAELPGFLSAAGLERCLADAQALASQAFWSRGRGTAYLEAPGESWPASHPRAVRSPYSVGVVAYDQFPVESPIRALYEWPGLRLFVAAILSLEVVHHYADPLGALNLAVMGDGDSLQWHFDQTDFVVSLALEPAARGGDFEVAPNIRTSADERYDAVHEVLCGDRGRVLRLAMTPGTLLVFAGRHSLHRVSPIEGPRQRLVALLGYDTRAGVRSTPQLQMSRYGRTL
jgi:hypothetical protein